MHNFPDGFKDFWSASAVAAAEFSTVGCRILALSIARTAFQANASIPAVTDLIQCAVAVCGAFIAMTTLASGTSNVGLSNSVDRGCLSFSETPREDRD